jgi:phenylpropionate dioxygenase-like ring-hydroxylating dioxygenase large terminal subunit
MGNPEILVDATAGVQKRKIFSAEEVYQLELEKVFGRCWLFLTHESEIPKSGDFVTTFMGEDRVLVVRQADGSVKAFLNSCRHRGNQVCRAESGNLRSFVCSYHGWTFGIDGALINVPLEKECYGSPVDKANLGLTPVAKVENFNGFVFGCLDPEAPSLRDYLGEMAWYMETFTSGGRAELLGPPLKSVLHTNWKLPAENFSCDGYHVGWTHAAALKVAPAGPLGQLAGNTGINTAKAPGIQIATRHGHGFGCIWNAASAIHRGTALNDYLLSKQPEVAARLGEWRGKLFTAHWDATIFPNCSFLYATNTFKVWQPKGPGEIEVWTWTMVDRDMSPELKRNVQKEAIRTFGTAGTFESDDAVNFHGCMRTNRGRETRKGYLTNSMAVGFDKSHPELPGVISELSFIGETAGRNFYRFWGEVMNAANWDEIRAANSHWTEDWLASKTRETDGNGRSKSDHVEHRQTQVAGK